MFIFLLISLLVVIFIIAKERKNDFAIYSPICLYLCFHMVCFVLRPLYVIYSEDNSIIERFFYHPPSPRDQVATIILTIVGLVFYYYGYRSVEIIFPKNKKKYMINKTICVLSTLPFIAIALYSIIKYCPLPWNNLRDFGESSGKVFEGQTGYIVRANFFLFPIIIVYLYCFGWRIYTAVPLLSFIVLRLYSGQSRFVFMSILFTVGIFILINRRQKWPNKNWVIVLLLLYIPFNMLGQRRSLLQDIAKNNNINLVQEMGNAAIRPLSSVDFANYDWLIYIQTYAYDVGLSYGQQYQFLLYWPIPRVIWKNKPLKTWEGDFSRYGRTLDGVGVSCVGDFFISLGWLGVMLGMFVVGCVQKTIYLYFRANMHVPYVLISYICLAALLPIYFRDGFISIFGYGFFFVIPGFITLYLSSKPVGE